MGALVSMRVCGSFCLVLFVGVANVPFIPMPLNAGVRNAHAKEELLLTHRLFESPITRVNNLEHYFWHDFKNAHAQDGDESPCLKACSISYYTLRG